MGRVLKVTGRVTADATPLHPADEGFTLVELMVVILIIGILVAIAIPVFNSAKASAQRRTCFANQRIIEGACQTYVADHADASLADLAGLVSAANPLKGMYIHGVPPRCPAAPEPADKTSPTAAEGAYTLDADGNVAACVFAGHGSYN